MSGRSSERHQRGPKSKRNTQVYCFEAEIGPYALLQLAIGAALSGGAIRIGLTRDMGALAIGVYKGDEYGTEYVTPAESLEQAVREISQDWEIPLANFDADADLWRIG